MNKILLIIILGVMLMTTVHAQQYSFAVVPQQSATKLAQLWVPILKKLSKQTGLTFAFTTAPNIPIFEKRLAEGRYDFAYMNPYHFTVFNQKPGYQALAKAKDKKIKGIIVIKKDSHIKQLSDLNKSSLAFPAPAAFAASILTRSKLSALGHDFKSNYVSSHDSVYRSVAKGLFLAGGGVVRTFKNTNPDINNALKILWASKGYTPHAIAAHPRVNQRHQDSLKKALIELITDKEGKRLVETIKLKGFVAAKNSDWDDVRALRIDLLDDLTSQ